MLIYWKCQLLTALSPEKMTSRLILGRIIYNISSGFNSDCIRFFRLAPECPRPCFWRGPRSRGFCLGCSMKSFSWGALPHQLTWREWAKFGMHRSLRIYEVAKSWNRTRWTDHALRQELGDRTDRTRIMVKKALKELQKNGAGTPAAEAKKCQQLILFALE